jgi:16S rRNA G966 N2-methylase RsmD
VTFVDAYAGTGAVGIEAVSWGAARAILMEKSRHALEVLEENVASLGIQGRVKVLRGSARRLLPRHEGDIVFLDPLHNPVRAGTLLSINPTIRVAAAAFRIGPRSPLTEVIHRDGDYTTGWITSV